MPGYNPEPYAKDMDKVKSGKGIFQSKSQTAPKEYKVGTKPGALWNKK